MQKEIISLDQGVIQALNFFEKNKTARLSLKKFKFPLVVGSGNAYNTGQILFSGKKSILADESDFREKIKNYPELKEAIIISASGEKDSVWEAKLAKKHRLKTILLTCSENSTAAKIADEVLLYPKIAEPYTYNISTYLGMILSVTQENPKHILDFLKQVRLKPGFKNYNSYSLLLDDKFKAIAPMVDIKKSELFGPKLSLRSFSFGQARHAKFVIRDPKELIINISQEKNDHFGDPKSRWQISTPKNSNFAFMLCLSYYLVGRIQSSKPPYFKKNIKNYCEDYGPKAYGKKKSFDIIVK
jgi:hypothetical protein